MVRKNWLLIVVLLVAAIIVVAAGGSGVRSEINNEGKENVPVSPATVNLGKSDTSIIIDKADEYTVTASIVDNGTVVVSNTVNLDCRWTPVRRNQQEPLGNVGTPGMELICTQK